MPSDKIIIFIAFLLIVNISMISYLVYQNSEISKNMAKEMQITRNRISDISYYLGDFSDNKNLLGFGSLHNKRHVTFSDVLTEMLVKLKSVEHDISSIQIQQAINLR